MSSCNTPILKRTRSDRGGLAGAEGLGIFTHSLSFHLKKSHQVDYTLKNYHISYLRGPKSKGSSGYYPVRPNSQSTLRSDEREIPKMSIQ